MDSSHCQRSRYTVITAPRLRFKPLTIADIPLVRPYLTAASGRTCDYTVGGLFMWAGYFNDSYAILNDTLYIKGVTEDDVTRPAFSLPVGKAGLEEAVDVLREYCEATDSEPLTLSAVPEVYVEPLMLLGATRAVPLDDWSDYLYDAQTLATLTGKPMSKKRNHVNRFAIERPGYTFEPITPQNIGAVTEFYKGCELALSKPVLAEVERTRVLEVLAHPVEFGFEGAVLSVPGEGIVAFTMGEVIGDTLYVHIEKMRHDIAGAGETVNKLFAGMMTRRHPRIRYINREEDTGDPGLRHAKQSYHPAMLLRKYNVIF